MSFGETYLWVLLGVVVSIVLPIAYRATMARAMAGTWWGRVWQFLKQYGWWIVVSLGGALVVVMLTQELGSRQAAFAAGLGWDSLWQRMSRDRG